METFLPEDVLEEEIKVEQPQLEEEVLEQPDLSIQEEFPIQSEVPIENNMENNTEQKEVPELSDFEKRRKAREEMRSRHRKIRKSGQKTEE